MRIPHPYSILAGGTQRLPRCLGVALAKELIFTGRRLSGEQAQALGLVNQAVAQKEDGNTGPGDPAPGMIATQHGRACAIGDHRWGGQETRMSYAITQDPFSQIYKINHLWRFCLHSAI